MFNEIPVYKISADQIEEGVDLIAVTSAPAIMTKGIKLSIGTGANCGAVHKFSSDERMIIAGPAMIPDKKIFRSDEDGEYYVVFEKEVISQMVEKFAATKSNRVFNVEHTEEMAPAFILEHWIIEDSEMDKSRKFGFNLPVGTWFVMAKVTDKKFWDEQVKANEKFGFSIEGLLGLKLNRNINMEKKKKFSDATLEDGTKIYAESWEVGQEVYVIDENLDKAPVFDGEHKLTDGKVIVTVGGKITEVKSAEEVEMAEEEVEVEMAEEIKEEVKVEAAEEVVVEEAPVVKSLTEDDVKAIVKPMFDELYAVLAEMKNAMMEEEVSEETEVEMSAVEQKFNAIKAATLAIRKK